MAVAEDIEVRPAVDDQPTDADIAISNLVAIRKTVEAGNISDEIM